MDLYVSCVPTAGPVTRFGMPTGTFIGAARSFQDPKVVTYDDAEIVFIPGSERRKFLSEYEGAILSGSLKVRTKEQYDARLEAVERRDQREHNKRVEAAKQAAKQAAAEPKPEATVTPEGPVTPEGDDEQDDTDVRAEQGA